MISMGAGLISTYNISADIRSRKSYVWDIRVAESVQN